MKYWIFLVGLFLTGLVLIEKYYFFQGSGLVMLGVVFVSIALILFNRVDTTEFALMDILIINYLPERPEIHEIVGTINEHGKISKKK